VNKPRKTFARPLSVVAGELLAAAFAKQGFASTELVARWPEIVGEEIAEHCEPERIKWPRRDAENAEPATLMVRVEGPVALEIQHLSGVILERVNRFFGWQAVSRLALRQAPLRGRKREKPPVLDPEAVAAVAEDLPEIDDEDLRQALARLGASVKRG
jgi:hypothetical protein